ncbi:MAG: nucleotidyltransferase family protein [Sphingomonadales bacterium]|nr:nucleotidyltransferase family protein [Sphingomonadales bacterium]
MPTEAKTAMVLAAGLGKRMRSFSSDVPKPMVEVSGVSLINRVLNKLEQAGISKAVVNLHHKSDQLKDHLALRTGGPEIVFSHETDMLLETGGGVKHALPHLGNDPFFVINSDALWTDGTSNTLTNMLQFWDAEKMDALLLVYPSKNIPNYQGQGDFCLDRANFLSRPDDGKVRPFVFTGIQIISPAIMAEFSDEVFSLNKVYDKASENGRLFGISHKGMWHHVGSGLEVAAAEKFYS